MFKKGFTIIEILIVVSIIAILASIFVGAFVTFRRSATLDRDTETVVENLRKARTQTLTSQDGAAYGIHFASTTVTLFTAPTYTLGLSTNQVYDLNTTDTVLALSLTGGGTDVIFARLTGETSQNGTITLSSTSASTTRIITVYKTGLIEFR
jgi:prepilin-type N-terminal cleavage/methylation domain-containing protein